MTATTQAQHRQEAAALFRSGSIAAAQTAAERACAAMPEDADAWALLAAIHAQQNNFKEIEACCRRVLALRPADVVMRYNLGVALQAQERHAEARDVYRATLATNRDYAEAWCNLGQAERNLGNLDAAIVACQSALRLKADLFEAHENLGLAYLHQARLDDAGQCFDRVVALVPQYAKGYVHLGLLREVQGESAEARRFYEHAIRLDAGCADGYYRVGRLLVEQDQGEEAEAYLRQALHLQCDHVDALISLGTLISNRAVNEAGFAEAEACFAAALAAQPANRGGHYGRGRLRQLQGKYADALADYEAALRTRGDFAEALAGKVTVLERMGRGDEARETLQRRRGSVSAVSAIALAEAALATGAAQRHAAVAGLQLALQKESSRGVRVDLHFAMGKLLDEAGEYDQAFAHFTSANGLNTAAFDPAQNQAWFARIAAFYNAERLATLPRAGNVDPRPIFIVGMPRSGTSLIEQILASHPDVHGAGELTRISELLDGLVSSTPFPECMADVNNAALDVAAESYLALVGALAGSQAARITDKMPHNFTCLGLIEQLFPAARIIHCRRDPRDTCLSIYFEKFNRQHAYAASLGDLGQYFRQYQALMAHWRSVIRLPLFEMSYEALVANQQQVSRELIEFCELEWDERCLRFHESGRIVATPSFQQVRQPLYSRSVARWRRYEKHLQPLLASLELDSSANDIAGNPTSLTTSP